MTAKKLKTRETQYQELLSQPSVKFGLMSGHAYLNDAKRLTFTLSRYKFVAKMISGKNNVLEVGCADGFGSTLVMSEVQKLDACDFDPVFIKNSQANHPFASSINFFEHNMVEMPTMKKYDAVYFLDVLEHIEVDQEKLFMTNACASLTDNGVCIAGMPSLESQQYASEISKGGHVNCKTGEGLRRTIETYFENVFIFSMNDEVVHTGFSPMAHYLIAIGCGKK